MYCSSLFLLILLILVDNSRSNYRNWNEQSVGVETNIDFVAAVCSTSEWLVVGYNDGFGRIVRTTDNGTSWRTVLFGGDSKSKISDISTTIGSSYYVAVSISGYVFVSINKGVNFYNAVNSGLSATLAGVTIGSNLNVFAVGASSNFPYYPKIFKSSWDAAQFTAWTDVSPLPTTARLLTAVSTRDGMSIVSVGYGGLVYYSSNAGLTWQFGSSSTTVDLQCVAHGGLNYTMAAGDNGVIIKSFDGGRVWNPTTAGLSNEIKALMTNPSTTSFRFHAISIVYWNNMNIYVSASNGMIIRSRDIGVTWTLDFVVSASSPSVLSIGMRTPYTGVAGMSRSGKILVRSLGKYLSFLSFNTITLLYS